MCYYKMTNSDPIYPRYIKWYSFRANQNKPERTSLDWWRQYRFYILQMTENTATKQWYTTQRLSLFNNVFLMYPAAFNTAHKYFVHEIDVCIKGSNAWVKAIHGDIRFRLYGWYLVNMNLHNTSYRYQDCLPIPLLVYTPWRYYVASMSMYLEVLVNLMTKGAPTYSNFV